MKSPSLANHKKVDVVLAIPTPPPFAGPELNGQVLLRHGLGVGFRVHHVRANIGRSNSTKGEISAATLILALRLWLRLVGTLLLRRPRIVYLFLSQNRAGFLRDAVIILTSWLCGARVVVHFRGGNFGNFYRHADGMTRFLVRFSLRRIAALILLGQRFRPQFKELVPEHRMRVLYNAVEVGHVDLGTRDFNGSFRVLFLGHLSRAKGFVDLLCAAPPVLDAIPEARFTFAGEWIDVEKNIFRDENDRPIAGKDDARQLWQDLQLRYGERLRYAGFVTGKDKSSTLADADVLVLPSYSEGFPMVVLEAMAAGLPVVVTPVGALPEVLQEGINCRFVNIGDVNGLANALVELAKEPETRRSMATANKELIRTSFTAEAMIERLTAILWQVARAQSGKGETDAV